MKHSCKLLCVALVLAALTGTASADEPASGREVFDYRCRTCHGGTAKADSPIGPSLAGIVGTKAGTQPTGVHSRALIESGIVWDRASLRRFLADRNAGLEQAHFRDIDWRDGSPVIRDR